MYLCWAECVVVYSKDLGWSKCGFWMVVVRDMGPHMETNLWSKISYAFDLYYFGLYNLLLVVAVVHEVKFLALC